MNKSKYEIILLDADETLFDFKKAESYAILESLKSFGYNPNKNIAKLYSKINISYWEKFEKDEINREELKKERFIDLFNIINLKADPLEFNNKYIHYLSEKTFMLKDAEKLVENLHKNFKLYIATNGLKKAQTKRLSNSPINKYIDKMFISEEVGYQKPQKEYFEYIFDYANESNKEKYIILGDRITSDIQGGKNAGIDTCLYDPENKIVSNLYNYKITRLLDFIKVVYK